MFWVQIVNWVFYCVAIEGVGGGDTEMEFEQGNASLRLGMICVETSIVTRQTVAAREAYVARVARVRRLRLATIRL